MATCENCGKPLKNIKGKRAKRFCDSTCRSGLWHRQNRSSNTVQERSVPVKEVVDYYEQFMKRKMECVSGEDWKGLQKEIIKSSDLTKEQTKLLLGGF
jgi:hypothetical protein